MQETAHFLYKKICEAPSPVQNLFLFLFSFLWLFLLSYKFPFMYDDVAYLIEAAKGFSFPEGFIFIPRFFFIYIYKMIFFFTGFQPFYFHLFKSLIGALLLYFYYKLSALILGKKLGIIATFFLLTSSLFVFTTIWIAEPITLALLLRIVIIFILFFYPESWKKWLLLLLLVPLAVFSKEPNIILLPLLSYFLFTTQKRLKRAFAVLPLLALFLYIAYVPVRGNAGFDLSNSGYFLAVLSKYYTPLSVALVALYILSILWRNIQAKNILNYNLNIAIILWFLLTFAVLLLRINQEERYIMEVLSSFLILLIQAILWLYNLVSKKYKKSIIFLTIACILFTLSINTYGIVKTEVGWGSFFRGAATVADTINNQYPGSLLVYQAGTGDFFSEFHNFTVLQFSEDVNMTLLYDLQQTGKYSSILYVSYPAEVSTLQKPPLDLFQNAFLVNKGIYTFEVHELRKNQ